MDLLKCEFKQIKNTKSLSLTARAFLLPRINMITLDTTTLSQTDDETYSAWKNDSVKLFINGNKLNCCLYCNVTKGFAIVLKTNLDGVPVVADDSLIHEIIFGDITVEKPITQTNLATGETVTFKD